MGLRTFTGDFPAKKDIGIAKNYLDEKELKVLNNIVSGYFDFEIVSIVVSMLCVKCGFGCSTKK